jgi:hypothetical protein
MAMTRPLRPGVRHAITAAAIAGLLAVASATTVVAADKVVICHAAGLADTDQYVELEIAGQAVYGGSGNAGHFDENGTPLAGHEEDYFGACDGGGGGGVG